MNIQNAQNLDMEMEELSIHLHVNDLDNSNN